LKNGKKVQQRPQRNPTGRPRNNNTTKTRRRPTVRNSFGDTITTKVCQQPSTNPILLGFKLMVKVLIYRACM
jgi:hypothetical protein